MQRSYNLLHEMQKKDEEKGKEEEHQKLASRMIASAEGGTGLLRKITDADGAERRSANSARRRKMSSRQPDVRRRGKNWQSTCAVSRRCKFLKTSHGEIGSCKVWRQECQV